MIFKNRAILLMLIAAPLAAQGNQRDSPVPGLAQGLMAGEATVNSVLLQARITSASKAVNSAWSGIPGRAGIASFEYAETPDFRASRRTGPLAALPENDFIVRARLSGLKPGVRYYYRLHYGEKEAGPATSAVAVFRTHAGPAVDAPYSFAVVTGMNYSFFHYQGGPIYPAHSGPDKHLGYPGLEAIRKLGPDYFVGTGDNVYYDHPGVAGRAETLHQLRMKHHEQFSQPRFLDLFRAVATYWEKDDHDYRFNDSDPVNPVALPAGLRGNASRISGSGSQPSHELGIYVFKEQLPVVADAMDPAGVTYRTHRVSRDLQVWFVEGRDYRSPNSMDDGPEKTIWGKTQKEWLKRTLLESDAAFKILISPTPMVGPDTASKRDSHVNLQGFRHERDEFFSWLVENGLIKRNFYIVCGDRHWQYHAVDPTGVEEFSVGTLVAANTFAGIRPGAPKSTDPKGLIRHLHFNEKPTPGFLVFKVGSRQATFTFYDEFGKPLYTVAKRAR